MFTASHCVIPHFMVHLFYQLIPFGGSSNGVTFGSIPLLICGSGLHRSVNGSASNILVSTWWEATPPACNPLLGRSIRVGRCLVESERHPANRVHRSLRIAYHGVVGHRLSGEAQAVAFTRQWMTE